MAPAATRIGPVTKLSLGTSFACMDWRRRPIIRRRKGIAMLRPKNSGWSPLREAKRAGAVGKALLVWLGTGSIGIAIVAYLLFAGMGC